MRLEIHIEITYSIVKKKEFEHPYECLNSFFYLIDQCDEVRHRKEGIMKVKINASGIENPLQFLEQMGYKDPKELEKGVYQVKCLGMDNPSVSLLDKLDIKYSKLITQLREEKGLSLEALSNIMLITPTKLASVENGTSWFSDSEINLCANVLGASVNGLKDGLIKPKVQTEMLYQGLSNFRNAMKVLQTQTFMLEAIQQINPPDRYFVQYKEEEKAHDNIHGYVIYDEQLRDLVKDESGAVRTFSNAKDALDAARTMELEYKLSELDRAQEEKIQGEIPKVKQEEADFQSNITEKAPTM